MLRNPRRLLAAAGFCFLLLLASPSALRGQEVAAERFADTVAVTAVEVPVQVIDGGRAVPGLTRESFEVFDRGERREITAFEVIDFAAPVAAGAEAGVPGADLAVAAAARRNLLLLFDLTFSSSGLLERAREGARTMVREQLGPRDRAAVAIYGNTSGVQILLGFTADRKALELALGLVDAVLQRKPKAEAAAREALEAHLYGDGPRPGRVRSLASRVGPAGALALAGPLLPPDVRQGSLVGGAPDGGGGGGGAGAAGEPAPSEGALAAVVAQDPAELTQQSLAEVELDAVRSLAEGLGQLATILAPVHGQNHLLYFSQGFSPRYLTGDVGVQSATSSLEEMMAAFRRSGWSIHAVDVTGLRPGGGGGGDIAGHVGNPGLPGGAPGTGFAADALLVLADGTGGELYENYNKMADATAQALERTRITYLLTITPGDLVADGSYRRLEVKVKGAPVGARVVHRPGYFAPKPAAEQSEVERRLAEAESILGTRQVADFPVRVLAAPMAVEGPGRARVPLLVEIPGAALADPEQGKFWVRIQGYALDDAGEIADFMVQDLSFDLEKLGDRLRAGGVRVYGELGLTPGVYRLRLQVEEAGGDRRHLTTVPIVVAGDGAGLELLPPLFLDLSGNWLMVKAKGDGRSQVVYPFSLGGRDVVPELGPQLAGGEARALVLLTRSPAGGRIALESRVRTAAGEVIAGGRLELKQRVPAGDDGFERLVASFAPEGLTPGEYRLEVSLVDQASGERVTRSAPFTVQAGL